MAAPTLTTAHLEILRQYVVMAELLHDLDYPSSGAVLRLSERVARYLADAHDGAAGLPGEEARLLGPSDVELLTRLGRRLIESAQPLLGVWGGAPLRMSLGQSLLDVRDAVESTLVVSGQRPERRGGPR